MKRKIRGLIVCLMACLMALSSTACAGGENGGGSQSEGSSVSQSESMKTDEQDNSTEKTETTPKPQEAVTSDSSTQSEPTQTPAVVPEDMTESQGLEFESNGDGTCSIVGIGDCKDKQLVIPSKSPDGDNVTLIAEKAFMSLEDVEGVVLLNCNYEIEQYAFEYSEIEEIKIIGGSPVIGEYAFYACEDVTSFSFEQSNLHLDEKSFASSGKRAAVSFTECTGIIDDYAFEYAECETLNIVNCDFAIGEYAFYDCEDLTSVNFTDSTLEIEKNAFASCGDEAVLEIANSKISAEDNAFEYSSLSSVSISGESVELGKYSFYACEDLTSVVINSPAILIDKNAFASCEDLQSVSLCVDTSDDSEIEIKDAAFEYCDVLGEVEIGTGNLKLGDYVFYGGFEDMKITVSGKSYTADELNDGLN